MSNYFNSIKNYDSHYVSILRFFEKRLVVKLFNKFIKNNGLSLEVGSGNGFYTKILDKRLDSFYKIDKSNVLLSRIDTENKICDDYINYKFNEKFNNVICMGAVEFIGEDFFEKTSEIIIQGGVCVICMPKKNVFGFFYNRFYKSKSINLFFYNNDLLTKLKKEYNILFNGDFMLNKYLVLEKK